MEVLRFALLISIGYFAAEGRHACQMSEQTIMKDAEECMIHNPQLAMEIAMHMSNPKALESTEMLCRYKSHIADLIDCLEHKLVDCFPVQAELLNKFFPKKSGILDGLDLLCKHKEEMNDHCFDEQMTPFMQCYMASLQSLSPTNIASLGDQIVCRVVRAEEMCFQQNKGHCSDQFISLIIQILEKVFPMEHCPKVLETLSNSILIHGQPLVQSVNKGKPLYFQPNNNRGYVIKN